MKLEGLKSCCRLTSYEPFEKDDCPFLYNSIIF